MSKLIAKVPIYYKGKQYIPGEEIPADDTKMVEAWKRADSVVPVGDVKTPATGGKKGK